MARARRSLAARLLRALGFGAVALLALLGVAIAFFPFERIGPALSARISRETGVATTIGALGASLSLRGPALEARDLLLRWPSGELLALDTLRVRAARPSAWLRGVPTAHVTAAAAFGSFEGDLSRELVSGALARFDFALLPPSWFGESGSPLAGAVDAQLELTRQAEAWSGSATLAGGEGSLALPGSPVAIPYEHIDAGARLDRAGALHLDSLALAGPMVSAHAAGEIAAGPAGLASGPIAIEVDIERMDPALLPALAQAGIALDRNGAGHVRITGTLGQLQVR